MEIKTKFNLGQKLYNVCGTTLREGVITEIKIEGDPDYPTIIYRFRHPVSGVFSSMIDSVVNEECLPSNSWRWFPTIDEAKIDTINRIINNQQLQK